MRAYTRLQGEAFGITSAALEAALTTIIAQGKDAVFLRIGESYESNDSLTARQVRALQAAVAFRTSAFYLYELLVDVNGGTYEPTLVAKPEDIERLLALFDAKAEEYEDLLQGRGETSGKRPRSRPAVSASTFTYSPTTDRAPSERFALQDESDDVSSADTENG